MLAKPVRIAHILILCGLVLFSGATAASTQIKPWKGATPALKLRDLGGKPFDIASLRGRVVLVNFWASWCDPCREEMPALERLRAKLKDRGFELITVNYGQSKDAASRFMEKLSLDLPVLLDPDKGAASRWNVRALPMSFLVDAGGKARFASFGEQDWSAGEPYRLVESLLDEAQRAKR